MPACCSHHPTPPHHPRPGLRRRYWDHTRRCCTRPFKVSRRQRGCEATLPRTHLCIGTPMRQRFLRERAAVDQIMSEESKREMIEYEQLQNELLMKE
jgi:hypothetical protein